MSFKTVNLMTANQDKLRVARQVFSNYDIEVASLDLDIPEIQAKTSLEVARYAVKAAFTKCGLPVIREDHSFYIDDLGIPGPFMAYMDKQVSADMLARIVDLLPSRNAHFELAASYIDETGRIFDSSYTVPVEIAHEPRGNEQLRWERVMTLPGDNRTFAELDDNRDDLWSGNYHAIAQFIVAQSVERSLPDVLECYTA